MTSQQLSSFGLQQLASRHRKTEELGAPNENFDVWVELVRSNSCSFNSLLKRWQPQEPFEAGFAHGKGAILAV